MLFLLVLCDVIVKKIVEFVGVVLIDEYVLFKKNLEIIGMFFILYEININDESLFY